MSKTDGAVTEIVVRVPGSAAASGGVVILSDTGAVVEKSNIWAFRTNGVINSIQPSVGHFGTVVTISGERLKGSGSTINSVYLAGVEAEIVTISDTEVTVVAQASVNAVSGDVVLTADTEATVTSVDGFSYIAAAAVSDVSPAVGQIGTRVQIIGERLRGAGASVTTVMLGGVSAEITSQTDDLVEVVVPRPDQGFETTNTILLIGAAGSEVEATDAWSYLVEGEIAEVSPTSGQFGTEVTVRGERLLGGGDELVSATLAGTPAKIIEYSNTQVDLVANTGIATRGSVIFTAKTGAVVTKLDAFDHLADGVIAAVSPPAGQQGTLVQDAARSFKR